jgi:hypothetical protein
MDEAARFSFTEVNSVAGAASRLPYLPLALVYEQRTVSVTGLLDTGATVNVLPYDLGLQLGATWERQTMHVNLTGNLARFPARVLTMSVTVAQFAPVRMAFAWTQADNVPLILGQVNFFLEFDVCFFRSQSVFEIKPKQG